MKRRSFLSSSAAIAAGFSGLQNYLGAQETQTRLIEPYGPLLPDTKGLLDLPKDFSYQIISKAGRPMIGGLKVPTSPDGMACFPGKNNSVILVRNHELSTEKPKAGPFPSFHFPKRIDPSLSYDPGGEIELPYIGGTTTLCYDLKEKKVTKEFLSLTGSDRNCAGGAMPWGTWITCEETENLTNARGSKHGYCFEVKASDDGKLQKAVPLKKLGRYRHEAVALDPKTNILYLTEDRPDGLLYRFIPDTPQDFTSGVLEALCIIGQKPVDTRNYPPHQSTISEGQISEISWIALSDVEAPKDDLRHRGFQAGAAKFARGEGIFYSNDHIYICCTDGGPHKQGQIYKLIPSREDGKNDQLELFLQPQANDLLTNGDNLCAAPWGDLIICEDLVLEHQRKTPHIRGITPDGKIYTIAKNAKNKGEFAGSCFSPDGSVLFVNMQTLGLTLAISGPWKKKA